MKKYNSNTVQSQVGFLCYGNFSSQAVGDNAQF